MCTSLFSAYLLVMSSTSPVTCIPVESMRICQKAIKDFSENFVETRRNNALDRINKTKGPGYTVIIPNKGQNVTGAKRQEFSLTCVRGKKLTTSSP